MEKTGRREKKCFGEIVKLSHFSYDWIKTINNLFIRDKNISCLDSDNFQNFNYKYHVTNIAVS